MRILQKLGINHLIQCLDINMEVFVYTLIVLALMLAAGVFIWAAYSKD